jgi:putative oxidoreductase
MPGGRVDSHEIVYLIARILSCGIWIGAGMYKATHFEHTMREMQGHRIPFARPVLMLVIGLELAGGLALIANYQVWAVCIAWLVFMVPATYIYHFRFLIKDGTIDFPQWITFWKNISIAGGLFALILLDTTRPAWLFAT